MTPVKCARCNPVKCARCKKTIKEGEKAYEQEWNTSHVFGTRIQRTVKKLYYHPQCVDGEGA